MGGMVSMLKSAKNVSHKETPYVTPATSPDNLMPDHASYIDGELSAGPHGEGALSRHRNPPNSHDNETSKCHSCHLSKRHVSRSNKANDGEAGEEPVQSLKRENHLLSRQLNEAITERESHAFELNQLAKEFRTEKHQKADACREVKQLRQVNDALQNELSVFQDKVDSLNEDLRKAQLSSFRQAQTGWLVEEDSEVNLDLNQLYRDVRLWAKTYTIKSLGALRQLPPETIRQIVPEVCKVAFFKTWADFLAFRSPVLILAAMLSDLLTNILFNRYFYIFNNPDEPSDNEARARVLDETFSRLSHSSASDAHMWRALLLRAAFANPKNSELTVRRELGVHHPERFLNRFIAVILYGPISHFIRPMEQEEAQRSINELQNLFRSATELFARLQTQRAGYAWHMPSAYLQSDFDVHSPALAADRLVKLEDEDDTSCNGKKIKVVVSPAVVRYGDSNGENYDTGHFLAKAVVFLEG